MAKRNEYYQDKNADEFDYDVIIIGSGLAGLYAAYNISQKNSGITVLLLEGSDKIGGRLGTSGASRGFFIDDNQTHINRFVRELGLTTFYRRRIDTEKRVFYTRNGPVVHEDKVFDEINGFVNGVDFTAESVRGLRTYGDYPEADKLARMSVDSLIKKFLSTPKSQELMNAIVYTICGVETTSVSALWFIVMAIGAGGLKRRIKFSLGTNRRQFFEDGAGKILEKLLDVIEADQRIKIQTESVVDLIEFNDVYAYVSLADGDQYKCQYVLVAVPPPQNSKIRIKPPCNDVLINQKSHEPGKGTFFIAMYDEAWWLGNNYSGEIIGSTDNPSGLRLVYETTWCSPRGTTESPVFLAGFFEGIKSGKKKLQSNHPLEYLRNCWSENETSSSYSTRCKSYSEWKWTDVENEREEGGYPMSVMRPCHIKTHVNPMLTPHERVYWACSEYARSWPGTLDGAVESGEYVSRSILFQLRPQSLNSQELRSIMPDTVMGKNDLPLDLVALHFVLAGITAAMIILYCKPVK